MQGIEVEQIAQGIAEQMQQAPVGDPLAGLTPAQQQQVQAYINRVSAGQSRIMKLPFGRLSGRPPVPYEWKPKIVQTQAEKLAALAARNAASKIRLDEYKAQRRALNLPKGESMFSKAGAKQIPSRNPNWDERAMTGRVTKPRLRFAYNIPKISPKAVAAIRFLGPKSVFELAQFHQEFYPGKTSITPGEVMDFMATETYAFHDNAPETMKAHWNATGLNKITSGGAYDAARAKFFLGRQNEMKPANKKGQVLPRFY